MLPSINLNKSLEKDWNLNLKLESRQAMSEGVFGGDSYDKYSVLLNDFAIMTGKKVGLNNSIAVGFLLRLEDNEFQYRTTQQFNILKKYDYFRLAYRLVTDQTFSASNFPEFRFRKRVTMEVPFNGTSLDPKEFYAKINNEYLHSIENNEYDLEIRLIPMIGYQFNKSNKFEFGIDYRVDSFVNSFSSHSFWTSLNWYLKI